MEGISYGIMPRISLSAIAANQAMVTQNIAVFSTGPRDSEQEYEILCRFNQIKKKKIEEKDGGVIDYSE